MIGVAHDRKRRRQVWTSAKNRLYDTKCCHAADWPFTDMNAFKMMTWVLDTRGAVVFRSQAWSDYTGIHEIDLRSRLRFHAVHPDDFPIVDRIVEDALQERRPFLVCYRMRKVDQTYGWVMTGGSPSHSPVDGEFVGYFGTTKPLIDPPARAQELESTRQIMVLDAIAGQIMNVRALAKAHTHDIVVKALELPLLLVGDLIRKAVGL